MRLLLEVKKFGETDLKILMDKYIVYVTPLKRVIEKEDVIEIEGIITPNGSFYATGIVVKSEIVPQTYFELRRSVEKMGVKVIQGEYSHPILPNQLN